MPIPIASHLLAYRERHRFARNADRRPIVGHVDDHGHALAYHVPAPLNLAAAVLVPALRESLDLYAEQRTRAPLARPRESEEPPTPLDLAAVGDGLRAALHDLPAVADEPDTYTYLRRFVRRASPAKVDRYIADTLAAMRRPLVGLVEYRPSRERVSPSSSRTAAERQADRRAARETREEASSAWWLDAYLDPENDGRPKPGTSVLASRLYGDAFDVLEDLEEDEESINEDDGSLGLIAAPRRRVFLRVAARPEHLGAPRHTRDGSAFTIPDQKDTAVHLDEIRTEADAYRYAAEQGERLLTIRERLAAGDRVGALRSGGYLPQATGTTGAVVDFAAAKAARQ